MLDIKFLRQHMDRVEASLKARGTAFDLSEFRSLDERRRNILQEVERLRNERNTVSRLIGEKKQRRESARMTSSPK